MRECENVYIGLGVYYILLAKLAMSCMACNLAVSSCVNATEVVEDCCTSFPRVYDSGAEAMILTRIRIIPRHTHRSFL